MQLQVHLNKLEFRGKCIYFCNSTQNFETRIKYIQYTQTEVV